MGERRLGQGGFADAFLAPGVGSNRRLERIEGLFDWDRIEAILKPTRSRLGRPGYPAVALFKAILLAQWYGLSDPGLEEALADRLSFRRFCGFALSDQTPDETVFVRFRAALVEHGISEALFDEVARQLDAHGLVLREGTMVDASLVAASVKRPPQGGDEAAARDTDAGFTRRGKRSIYGYQAHVAVDLGSDLIRKAILTSANVAESLVADRLIAGDERAVYADKGYENKHRRRRLKDRGIKDRIMHRSHKNQAELPRWQDRRNALIAPIRANVERVFGTLKRSYGYRRVRYRGLPRNQTHLDLLCIALNLRRAETLLA